MIAGATKRMRWALLLLALTSLCAAAAADPNKVLRVALPDVDTLDPQQATTVSAQRVIQAIYEGLYNWDYLNTPAGLVPVVPGVLCQHGDQVGGDRAEGDAGECEQLRRNAHDRLLV